MWPNIVDCIESDLNIKSKLSYLNTSINVYGLNLEVENELKFVKKKIKEFSADATKRNEGLLLLYAVVHSSSKLYVENWSQIVLGSLKTPDSFISREIPLNILNRMLMNFGRDIDCYDAFSKVMPDILTILLHPEDDEMYKLYCQSLAASMIYVPDIAGFHVDEIQTLLLKGMDNPYGGIIEAIGECFAAIPLCILHYDRMGTLQYKDIWCNMFTKFLNTIHSLLNNLLCLSDDQEEYVDVMGLPVFDIPSLETSDNPIVQIDVFKSLCLCMAKMMSSGNHYVRLPLTDLLKLKLRVFQVEKIIKSKDQDTATRYLLLGFPQMLNGAFVVLEALILNFRIVEQSHNFMALINMSFNSMVKTFSQSSANQVRGSTWKLISIWLDRYGSKGSYEVAKDKTILQEILSDICIEEKQLGRINIEDINEKENANKIFACTQALRVLKRLFETSSCYMEKNSVDKISTALIKSAKIILRLIAPRKRFPLPYSDEKCRKLLFDVLNTCAIHSDPLHSKCIMEAQNIFNIASRDTSTKVGRICHRFRKLSRYYLNPRKPPPEAFQYSHSSMLNGVQQPVIESVRAQWGNVVDWNNENGPSSDDQMDDNETTQVLRENTYSDKLESEGNLMPIEETGGHINHHYRRMSKQSSQSMGEEESVDDSDVEPTYVPTDTDHQRIGLNDSSHINSYGIQPCVEQYGNETRTERCTTEEIVPIVSNSVENNVEEHVSTIMDVKSIQKPQPVPMGNGEWKKKEITESDEDDSDMDEEGEEEGEVNEENEEVSDNACEEASEGKHSPEFDDERPCKRQKCMDEEGEDMDEEVEDEDNTVNNQSSDEEINNVNNVSVLEQNDGIKSENIDDGIQEDIKDSNCRSPTIREMCGDFVLAEPTSEIS